MWEFSTKHFLGLLISLDLTSVDSLFGNKKVKLDYWYYHSSQIPLQNGHSKPRMPRMSGFSVSARAFSFSSLSISATKEDISDVLTSVKVLEKLVIAHIFLEKYICN